MLPDSSLVAFLPSADLDRARTFFESVLELPLVEQTPFACVFSCRGTTLRVTDVGEYRPAPFTVLGWEVPDIVETCERLASRGVMFERYSELEQDRRGVWTTPGGDYVAWFKDADGNVLSITELT
jgi:catechol 2,3-dioxygenase-like lactoylglutathione lyase family enzyme